MIEYQQDEHGLAHIVLNRKDKNNALNAELIYEFNQALDHLQNTRALILSSSAKHFCAGADLKWLLSDENVLALSSLLAKLYALPFPTIAAVHGAVLGGGAGLASCCDFVVAADTTWFSFTEVKLGLIPAMISPYITEAIGSRLAKQYFLTAEKINVTRAHEIHLVTHLGDINHAFELAAQLLENSSIAMHGVKKLFKKDVDQHQLISMLESIKSHPDTVKRLNQFFEKS